MRQPPGSEGNNNGINLSLSSGLLTVVRYCGERGLTIFGTVTGLAMAYRYGIEGLDPYQKTVYFGVYCATLAVVAVVALLTQRVSHAETKEANRDRADEPGDQHPDPGAHRAPARDDGRPEHGGGGEVGASDLREARVPRSRRKRSSNKELQKQ